MGTAAEGQLIAPGMEKAVRPRAPQTARRLLVRDLAQDDTRVPVHGPARLEHEPKAVEKYIKHLLANYKTDPLTVLLSKASWPHRMMP